MVGAAGVMAADIQVAASANTGIVCVVERTGVDLSCCRGSNSCGYGACEGCAGLNNSCVSAAGRDAKEMRLAGGPIEDRRIRNAGEARLKPRSETGGATGIVPVVHP